MQSSRFRLEAPVRLVPLKGETTVDIKTTGSYKVIVKSVSNPKPPVSRLSHSDHGRLTQSPAGHSRTVKITLPEGGWEYEDFLREMFILFAR